MNERTYHNQIDDFQIDRIERNASFDMGQPHYHPYYELYYLITGQCKMFIGHTLYYVFPGDLILIPPEVLHRSLYEHKRPVERITVSFTPDYVCEFIKSCGIRTWNHIFSRTKLALPAKEQKEVTVLLEYLLAETIKQDVYSPIQKKVLLFELLTYLGRCRNLTQRPQILDQVEASIQETARYIYEHYQEAISLSQAAQTAHMSATYFSRKFKEATGFGFKEYLNHIRLQEACHLLSTTTASITEIALICGFSDGNYFGDTFKRAFGISPSLYRKKQVHIDN